MDESRHPLWQTAWGVVAAAIAGVGAIYWQTARGADARHRLPIWPLWIFGIGLLISLYFVFAPVLRVWPFSRRRGEAKTDPLAYSLRIDDWKNEFNSATGTDTVSMKVHSTAEVPVRYRIEKPDVRVQDRVVTIAGYSSDGGVIPRLSHQTFYFPELSNLPIPGYVEIHFRFILAYGPPDGDIASFRRESKHVVISGDVPDADGPISGMRVLYLDDDDSSAALVAPAQQEVNVVPDGAPPQRMTHFPGMQSRLRMVIIEERPFHPTQHSLGLEAHIAVTNVSQREVIVTPLPEVRSAGKYLFGIGPSYQGNPDEALQNEQNEGFLEIDRRLLAFGGWSVHTPLAPGGKMDYWIAAGPYTQSLGEPEYTVILTDEFGHEYGVTRFGVPK